MLQTILLFIIFSCCLFADSEVVYLTWQNDPSSTMTIHWLSKLDDENHSLEYSQSDGESKWLQKSACYKPLPENAPYNINTIELTALQPDTVYKFHILPSKEEHSFRTMPKTNDQSIRFVVGGDLFDKDQRAFETICKTVAKHSPRFVLLGGDLAYSVTAKRQHKEDFSRWYEFLRMWSTLLKDTQGAHIPLLPVIGNHEVKGYFHQTPKEAPFFYALFATPGPDGYKMIRFGSYLSVALLDSGHTHPVGGAQTEWLKSELSKQIAITHRFALYHVPAFPSVRSYRGAINTSIRNNWCPLFEKYGIHAAFENHDHAFKRTHPLVHGDIDRFGVVYFGDGCWGTHPRIPKKATRTGFLAVTKSTRQFLQVDLTKTKRTYTAFDPNDVVVDTYIQEVDKPNPIDK